LIERGQKPFRRWGNGPAARTARPLARYGAI
jgi:hypothetical protein